MNERFPFPKRYYVYVTLVFVFAFLLLGNVFRTDGWTGDTPFSEFKQKEWFLFAIFMFEELVMVFLMFIFSVLAGKISKKRNQQIREDWERNKYADIKPGDYDYVWFDFSQCERALILKQDEMYKLYVDDYDEHSGNWQNLNQVSIYDSLEELKRALFFEFDFYCEENAELDKYGNERYKSKQKL